MTDRQAFSLKDEPLHNYKLATDQFARTVGGIPNNRAYALDEVSLRGGVALLRAVLRTLDRPNIDGELFTALLTRVGKYVPSLTQSWRPPAEEPVPEVWRDEVTGLALPNPFSNPPDLIGQAILRQRNPALADHLEKFAKSPYELIASIRDGRAHREQLRAIRYNAAEHKENPFRKDDQIAQSAFTAVCGQTVADIWRQEAGPVRLPWCVGESVNRTQMGRLIMDLRAEPMGAIGSDIIPLAHEIDNELLTAMRDTAANEQQAASERLARLQ